MVYKLAIYKTVYKAAELEKEGAKCVGLECMGWQVLFSIIYP